MLTSSRAILTFIDYTVFKKLHNMNVYSIYYLIINASRNLVGSKRKVVEQHQGKEEIELSHRQLLLLLFLSQFLQKKFPN